MIRRYRRHSVFAHEVPHFHCSWEGCIAFYSECIEMQQLLDMAGGNRVRHA